MISCSGRTEMYKKYKRCSLILVTVLVIFGACASVCRALIHSPKNNCSLQLCVILCGALNCFMDSFI